ncbi:DUF1501 domain-containing protein [Stieleria sp. JC731]|uniref:DUF1501 domain-containing protein n=1 Tax=Pirellulaceae TaxID=2691357 RepID=UPI001E5F5D32|nr:DUF1501 domain-containing protein [Stieleria sp. JC731]MCC9602025.1 DUF1501 domain-containing protein [Stieleria sp. JC731]
MNRKYCDGLRRRDFVRIGSLAASSAIPLTFCNHRLFAANKIERAVTSRAKSCILVWLDGGPTHLETFDPKPNAPSEIRGPFDSISTSVAGVRLGDNLPLIAKQMDKISIIRSMTSPLGEHNFGSHYLLTGYKPSAALKYPTIGAAVTSQRSKESVLPANVLPASIAVPRFTNNVTPQGFLAETFAPFEVRGNLDDPKFAVRDLETYPEIDLDRLTRRQQFVRSIDRLSGAADVDRQLARAYELVLSADAKSAFSLDEEPQSLRRRYGRGGGHGIGQGCLLARRLVERGVDFVTVHSAGWDSHQDLTTLRSRFPGDRNALLPSLDRAVGTLIEDLHGRGLLDETLVVVMGEFGRTPKVNVDGGRDHWPNVFSVVIAGGGVRGGQVIGASDALGESPLDRPITPSDLAASIYTQLGIDPSATLQTPDGRTIRLTPEGSSPVRELVSTVG